MEFKDGGGVFELVPFAHLAFMLEVAELLERFLELAREAGAMEAEAGEEAMGVDDVESGGLGAGGWGLGAVEDICFEERDAIEAPRGVGQFFYQLGFSCICGLVFIYELAAVVFISCLFFGGEDERAGG
ncbi:MAG TPA: hypothetical protein VGP62_29305 [Bryobacteraceae bacterium]|nr:hypothetical protein [Bryobacteraceae bacterium]